MVLNRSIGELADRYFADRPVFRFAGPTRRNGGVFSAFLRMLASFSAPGSMVTTSAADPEVCRDRFVGFLMQASLALCPT